jgi:hypothetical protein
MKKIRRLAIILSFLVIIAHVGCMSTDSPARGGLSGVVSDSAGNPLSGVKVATNEASTLSDVNGKWLLEALTPQITQISASREKYQSQSRSVEVLSGETLAEVNFVMAADSEIYDIKVAEVSSTRARIIFYTKNQSKGYVRYGTNGLINAYTPQDSENAFLHQYELTGLSPATTYRFKCIALDNLGRTLESELQNFTTEFTVRGNPPTGLRASKPTDSVSIKLDWNADSAVDFAGYKVYKAESASSVFVQAGAVMQNSFTDMEVVPGRKYYYRVTRVSGSGDETPQSETASFLMPGRMDQNAVWTAQNSPYLLTGDLSIAPGVSLVIDKGVTIGISKGDQWDPDSNEDLIDILVQGTLMIQGTSEEPVTMTSVSTSPASGDWNGISFDLTADLNTSLVKGLQLSYAVDGINGLAGIPEVRDSRLFNCRQAGIRSSAARQAVVIRNVEIDTCASGMLINDNPVDVKIYDNRLLRCVYGIVARRNNLAEVLRNTISFAGVSGIDLENTAANSITKMNLIGYGSNGSGIICRGNDEVRRNTIHTGIGIEIKETATARIRSNLILADATRNTMGMLYSGSSSYVAGANMIQYNMIWDIASGNSRRYSNTDGTTLPNISSDLRFDPSLTGGSPFVEFPNLTFSYVPSPGSALNGAGLDGEDVGAFDVPD